MEYFLQDICIYAPNHEHLLGKKSDELCFLELQMFLAREGIVEPVAKGFDPSLSITSPIILPMQQQQNSPSSSISNSFFRKSKKNM